MHARSRARPRARGRFDVCVQGPVVIGSVTDRSSPFLRECQSSQRANGLPRRLAQLRLARHGRRRHDRRRLHGCARARLQLPRRRGPHSPIALRAGSPARGWRARLHARARVGAALRVPVLKAFADPVEKNRELAVALATELFGALPAPALAATLPYAIPCSSRVVDGAPVAEVEELRLQLLGLLRCARRSRRRRARRPLLGANADPRGELRRPVPRLRVKLGCALAVAVAAALPVCVSSRTARGSSVRAAARLRPPALRVRAAATEALVALRLREPSVLVEVAPQLRGGRLPTARAPSASRRSRRSPSSSRGCPRGHRTPPGCCRSSCSPLRRRRPSAPACAHRAHAVGRRLLRRNRLKQQAPSIAAAPATVLCRGRRRRLRRRCPTPMETDGAAAAAAAAEAEKGWAAASRSSCSLSTSTALAGSLFAAPPPAARRSWARRPFELRWCRRSSETPGRVDGEGAAARCATAPRRAVGATCSLATAAFCDGLLTALLKVVGDDDAAVAAAARHALCPSSAAPCALDVSMRASSSWSDRRKMNLRSPRRADRRSRRTVAPPRGALALVGGARRHRRRTAAAAVRSPRSRRPPSVISVGADGGAPPRARRPNSVSLC